MKTQYQQDVEYLEKFSERWEAADANLAALSIEYLAWCTERGYEPRSADELLAAITTHTPAPWNLPLSWFDPERNVHAGADKALADAAPDLLKSLRILVAIVTGDKSAIYEPTTEGLQVMKARALIAKLGGRAS